MINFNMLLSQLGPLLEIENLDSEDNETCLIIYPADDLRVLIEVAMPEGESLNLSAMLGPIPLGGYREDLLKAALMENGKPYPRFGTLGFSEPNENLAIAESLPEEGLTGTSLFHFLENFTKKSRVWREALENNTIPYDKFAPGPEKRRSEPFGIPPA
jgi:hypothetical protein